MSHTVQLFVHCLEFLIFIALEILMREKSLLAEPYSLFPEVQSRYSLKTYPNL